LHNAKVKKLQSESLKKPKKIEKGLGSQFSPDQVEVIS
jgi:hypothetical protein